jgi:hypothetical protein
VRRPSRVIGGVRKTSGGSARVKRWRKKSSEKPRKKPRSSSLREQICKFFFPI